MQPNFWHAVWEKDSIGFHQDDVHPFLLKHGECLFNKEPAQVENIFIPLCGKSLDIVWLAQHFNVVGSELSDIACRDFFTEHQLTPKVTELNDHKTYQFKNITMWQGDHFKLPVQSLPPFKWIYDRAALIALPKAMQSQYVTSLTKFIDDGARLVLVSLEFPPEQLEGPPFPIFSSDIQLMFKGYEVEELDSHELPNKQFARRQFNVDYLIERLYVISRLGQFQSASP